MSKTAKIQSGSGKIKKFFSGAVKWWDYLILFCILAFCFFSYEMRDLFHTAGCSYGYLDGHFFDFYDYLSAFGIAEDGTIGLHASYLPTVYLIFAIWNLPMKLFGIVGSASAALSIVPIMWAKILPCLVYFFAGFYVYKIGRLLGMDENKSKILLYAYLSMPVGIFSQFILGQYESFLMFFMILGLYFWLREKEVGFLICFAVAMTFKYTAILFFLPLILLREKNIFRILAKTVCGLLLVGIFMLIYSGSPAFKEYVFGIGSSGDPVMNYIFNAAYFTGFTLHENQVVYLSILAFSFVIALAYFQKCATKDDENRMALWLVSLSFSLFFAFSKWHPQWLLMAAPFWTIAMFMQKNTKIFMALELIFGILFVGFTVCEFWTICDEVMLNQGVWKYVMQNRAVASGITMNSYLGFLSLSLELSLLTAILLVYGIFTRPKYMADDLNLTVDKTMGWIRARYIGTFLVMAVPSVLCVLKSVGV